MNFDGFIGPSYKLDSVNIDAQKTINIYPKMNEMGRGKEAQVMSFIGTPGLELALTLGSGPIRGMYRARDGKCYVVSGQTLYRIENDFSSVNLGDLKTTTGNVSMSDNGTTLIVVDGDYGYKHTLGSYVISQITDAGFLGATHVDYLDGYFILFDPNTEIFYISALDGVTFDALDFSSADSAPDNIVSLLVNHGEVWFFGRDSVEAWYNSGNTSFPIERIGAGRMEMGCVAPRSVAKIDKVTFWLGSSKDGHGIVYGAIGFDPQRISTHAIEVEIQSYSDISDAIAWTYQENGHQFYVLNFPTGNKTWVFDLTTRLWHQRSYFNDGIHNRHRASFHAFCYNTHLVGDWENGKLYKLKSDVYTDNGDEIRRVRSAPHLSSGSRLVSFTNIELDVERGVGLISGQGNDPKYMLRYSDDGGHTWSNEREASLGKMGERKPRVKWFRLGSSRDRVFEISISDPVKVAIVGARINE